LNVSLAGALQRVLFGFLTSLLLLTGMHGVLKGQEPFDQNHARFAVVLKEYLKGDRVDYQSLKENSAQLQGYLDQMSEVSQVAFKAWSRNDQLAYLFNLYNAQTLQLILDHYPLNSIRDIGHIFSGPWDQQVVRLFGARRSLDYLEHGVIRKHYAEPRTHFALVCAAKGCPPLRDEPYLGRRLERQLEEQGKRFMGTSEKNRIDHEEKKIYLSPIFKWFKKDFLDQAEDLIGFIAPYVDEDEETLRSEGYKIAYTHYDWLLNETE
jgi:hypothetical protein